MHILFIMFLASSDVAEDCCMSRIYPRYLTSGKTPSHPNLKFVA